MKHRSDDPLRSLGKLGYVYEILKLNGNPLGAHRPAVFQSKNTVLVNLDPLCKARFGPLRLRCDRKQGVYAGVQVLRFL